MPSLEVTPTQLRWLRLALIELDQDLSSYTWYEDGPVLDDDTAGQKAVKDLVRQVTDLEVQHSYPYPNADAH